MLKIISLKSEIGTIAQKPISYFSKKKGGNKNRKIKEPN